MRYTWLDELCKSEINFWKNHVSELNVRHIFAVEKINISCCDASSVGLGAIMCNDTHTAHKQWTEMEAKKSSNWRELETIHFAICSFLQIVSNSQLKIYTDSQSAAHIVESGSMKSELQNLAVSIFNTCLINNVRLDVQWIPRNQNEHADFISRLLDIDDWGISQQILQVMNELWGPLIVDCFASYYNANLPRFFSRFWNPGTADVDAFAQNWSNENCRSSYTKRA